MGAITDGVPLRERQRQERETLILRAAGELFVERGYHETSMEDIAARVGIAKGTVYLHFASKEDLTFALFERGVSEFVRGLDAILTADGSPRGKLEAIFERVYGSMSDSSFQLFSSAFRSPEVMARLHEKRQILAAMWEAPAARLTEVLEEGKAAGEFDPDMPTPIMLNLLLGLLAPHRWERPMANKAPPSELAHHISRFFFKGIAPCEHAPPPARIPAP